MPATLTFTLSQQSRVAGSYDVGPATVPAGYSDLQIQLNLDKVSYENAANRVTWTTYYSTDGGSTWTSLNSGSWQGGGTTGKGGVTDPPPVIGVGVLAGWQVKGTIVLNRTMTLGATLLLN